MNEHKAVSKEWKAGRSKYTSTFLSAGSRPHPNLSLYWLESKSHLRAEDLLNSIMPSHYD
jgi:hypothetical protein